MVRGSGDVCEHIYKKRKISSKYVYICSRCSDTYRGFLNKDKSPVSFYGVTANNVADNFGELFIGEKPEGQFPSEIVWTDSVGRAQLAVSILCPLPGTVSWKNTGREKLMEEIREYGVTQEDDSFCCDDLLNELDRLSLNIENFIILIQKRWRGFLIRKYLNRL